MKTQSTIKYASLGTVSNGTLRHQDLLETFIQELGWQIQRNGEYLSKPENFVMRDRLNKLVNDALESAENDVPEYVNELQDALDEFAGPYRYFGAHPGDGSDFGFWPDMDSIHELPIFESGDDIALPQDSDYAVVSDHGNLEIYSADGVSLFGIV